MRVESSSCIPVKIEPKKLTSEKMLCFTLNNSDSKFSRKKNIYRPIIQHGQNKKQRDKNNNKKITSTKERDGHP